ncbi:MAG TPA: hypothetical protein VIR38_04915 [Thalassobaculum sp.]
MSTLRKLLAIAFFGALLALGACNQSDGPVHELEEGIDHIGDQFD